MEKCLIIFDLDGTLFQTNEANYRAYKRALELCGFTANINYVFFKDHCNGKSYKTFLPMIIPDITDPEMELVHKKKNEIYLHYLSYVRKNYHLFNLIQSMKTTSYIALVTTASKENTWNILNHFHVLEVFDLIVTQKDVEHHKPDPEGFIKAMQFFDVSPRNTLIFEDSDVGIKAAAASKADYVRVYGYN